MQLLLNANINHGSRKTLYNMHKVVKFPIVIDSGTVNFSYMLYYVTFANQIICTFSLVLKSPLENLQDCCQSIYSSPIK